MMGHNNKQSGRRDSIVRAIRLVQMFNTRREVTVRNIMDEFEITKQSAAKWLDAISLVYPVYEVREEDVIFPRGGRSRNKRKIYALAK